MTVALGRAAATRSTLLTAAREVFTGSGYDQTSVAEVVGRAVASVGSLYHHFGGKADLYLALFEDYCLRQEARAAGAVRAAREQGADDPFALFTAGARAYLDGCWVERDLARLFLAGGGPAEGVRPRFAVVSHDESHSTVIARRPGLRPAQTEIFSPAGLSPPPGRACN